MPETMQSSHHPLHLLSLLRRSLSLMTCVLLVTACATPQQDIVLEAAPSSGPVTLAAGDVIRVQATGHPELATEQTIQPDGYLNLPAVGRVQAAGRTLSDLQQELRRRYASTIRDADAVVTLESTASVVYLSGAVNRPGRISLNRPMTVFEVVMEGGGFAPGADPGRVRVIRRSGGQHRGMTVNLSGALRSRVSDAAFVQPYDVIHVPEGIF